MTSRDKWSAIALLGLVVAVHGWSLLRFPFPFADEAWLASRAWAFVDTGRAFGPLDGGVFDRFDGPWTAFPWLPTAIQSLALRLVPEPNLLVLRCTSLLFGLALLAAVFEIAKSLYSRRVGLLAVLILAFSWPFLYSAHLARHDIMAALFGFAAIALYFNNPSQRFFPGLLSGLCLGAAFETHAHAAIFVPALGALYFFDLRWTLFRKAQFWGVVIGGLLGLLFYAALHLLPYPQTYATIYRLWYAHTHVPPILSLDLGILLQTVGNLGSTLFVTHHAMLVVITLASLFLLKRHSIADQRLLILNAALLLSTLLLVRNKAAFYVILFSPALALMVAVFLSQFLRQPWQGRVRDYLRYVLVVGCTLCAILVNLLILQLDSYRPYQAAQTRINQSIRPDDTILAAQTYWFGLYDHVYYSWENLIWFQRYAPGSTLEDAFREFRPTVFIIDSHVRGFISDKPGTSTYAQYLSVSDTELQAFLARYGELVDEFDVRHYGLIQVYRLHWENAEETRRWPPSPVSCLVPDSLPLSLTTLAGATFAEWPEMRT